MKCGNCNRPIDDYKEEYIELNYSGRNNDMYDEKIIICSNCITDLLLFKLLDSDTRIERLKKIEERLKRRI
ncbi:MAG: hypothetical protein ACOC2W_03720 [bacterium]